MKASPPRTTTSAITAAFAEIASAISVIMVVIASSISPNRCSSSVVAKCGTLRNAFRVSHFIYVQVFELGQSLMYNPKVEKSLANLKAMGLSVEITPESVDECFIFIRLDSLMRMIEKRITYPHKKLKVEDPFIVIDLWRVH